MFEKKKAMITFITFFDGFVAKKENSNYHSLFRWFCCEESDGSNVIAFFYGGGAVKNMMTVSYCRIFFFIFFIFWVLLV